MRVIFYDPCNLVIALRACLVGWPRLAWIQLRVLDWAGLDWLGFESCQLFGTALSWTGLKSFICLVYFITSFNDSMRRSALDLLAFKMTGLTPGSLGCHKQRYVHQWKVAKKKPEIIHSYVAALHPRTQIFQSNKNKET